MTDDARTPWWYSGEEGAAESGGPSQDGPPGQDDSGTGSGVDWLGLLASATRMVDWAAGAVVEPHSAHTEPADHPDCLVCRTLALVQDRTGMTSPRPDQPVPAEPPRPASPIRWIPVVD